jgi:hypothetical protein
LEKYEQPANFQRFDAEIGMGNYSSYYYQLPLDLTLKRKNLEEAKELFGWWQMAICLPLI